jgi:hypothetical protein
LALDWDYPLEGPNDEPVVEAILKEINGWTVADRRLLPGSDACHDDSSTACGCWIYLGVYPEEGKNSARSRVSDEPPATWKAALIGCSGVWGPTVDTSRRTLTIEYAPDLTNRAKLAQIIRQAGYPLREQPVPPPEHDAVHPEAESGAEPH